MRCVRRVTAAAAVVLVSVVCAFGDDGAADVRRAIEEAARDGRTGDAVALLDRLVAPEAPRDRARHVAAARAAMEFLPSETGAPYAARLLAEALRLDPSDADGAWSAAQDLRRDLLRRVDAENGARFLEKLIEIYPAVSVYRHDLGVLLLDAGRRDEAIQVLELMHRTAPSDTRAAYILATLAEDAGDTAAALRWYEAVLRERPGELRAHLLMSVLLATTVGDLDAARAALDAGARAATAAAAPLREDYLRRFDEERRRIAGLEARRRDVQVIARRIDVTLAGLAVVWLGLVLVAARTTRPLPAPTRGT